MAAAHNDPKRKPPPRLEDIELAPDAWERFTRTVRRMAETPPKPHKNARVGAREPDGKRHTKGRASPSG